MQNQVHMNKDADRHQVDPVGQEEGQVDGNLNRAIISSRDLHELKSLEQWEFSDFQSSKYT